ncbi:MAG TPA: glycosyltransferase [Opitutaceae bacterium]|nr:glycosyltransferase [Opitutaceae bacterium]
MNASIPKTGVLINNFNNGPFLEHCLESIFSQVPPPDEVIFYDDGSTDNSLEIIQPYAAKLTVIARPHGQGSPMQNQADAIHAAFRASTAEIIFLMDGDDAFLPGKIAAYLEAFAQKPNTVMVQAPLEKVNESGQPLGIEFEPARHQDDYLAHIYAENELNIYYPTSALAFRRDYLERALPLDLSDGLAIWPDARLALVAPLFGHVAAIPRPFSQWRRHPRSHTVVRTSSIYQHVRLHQTYFNAFSRALKKPTISPWRSRHHRRRWLRHYFLPDFLVNTFRRVRWLTLSKEKKRQMLMGPNPAEMEKELQRLRRQGLSAG